MNCDGAHKRVVWICLFRISARTSTNVLSDGTLRQQTESRLHRTVCRGGRLEGPVRQLWAQRIVGLQRSESSRRRTPMDDQINSHLVELAGYSSWYPQFVFGAPLRRRGALPFTDVWRCRHKCRGPGLSSSPGRTISNESDCLLHALIIQ